MWGPVFRSASRRASAFKWAAISGASKTSSFEWAVFPRCGSARATGAKVVLRATGALALASGLVKLERVDDRGEPLVAKRSSSLAAVDGVDFQSPGLLLDSSQSVSETAASALRRVRSLTYQVARGVEERSETREGRTILQLIAANAAVYTLWKAAPTTFMVRHFASSLEAMRRGRVWTVVTSNFSHMGIFHLTANMFLLDMFGRDVASILTAERFYVLYLAGGIASVLTSLASRRIMRNNVLSLGASGSVMATMFMYANLFPEREVYILGIWKLKARDAIVGWALVDAAGLLGSFGKIDFAAHLGGGAFSFGYYNFIREDLSREYLARKRLEWRRAWGFGADDE